MSVLDCILSTLTITTATIHNTKFSVMLPDVFNITKLYGGIHLYKIQAVDYSEFKKMILLR